MRPTRRDHIGRRVQRLHAQALLQLRDHGLVEGSALQQAFDVATPGIQVDSGKIIPQQTGPSADWYRRRYSCDTPPGWAGEAGRFAGKDNAPGAWQKDNRTERAALRDRSGAVPAGRRAQCVSVRRHLDGAAGGAPGATTWPVPVDARRRRPAAPAPRRLRARWLGLLGRGGRRRTTSGRPGSVHRFSTVAASTSSGETPPSPNDARHCAADNSRHGPLAVSTR